MSFSSAVASSPWLSQGSCVCFQFCLAFLVSCGSLLLTFLHIYPLYTMCYFTFCSSLKFSNHISHGVVLHFFLKMSLKSSERIKQIRIHPFCVDIWRGNNSIKTFKWLDTNEQNFVRWLSTRYILKSTGRGLLLTEVQAVIKNATSSRNSLSSEFSSSTKLYLLSSECVAMPC